MPATARITPYLWFDTQTEEAVSSYTAIFPNSRITHVSRYSEAGRAMQAMLKMARIDIAALQRAYDG